MEQPISQPALIPDAVLIERILAGEKKLFEWIIRRYNQKLFRNRSSFGTWLTRIMLNECLYQKKKEQRRVHQAENEPEKNVTMTTPAQLLVNKELSGVLENAISQLPEKYRLVFIIREIEEMSVKETAETLDIEESNVKVRLNRAKTMLKEYLNGYMKDHVYSFHLSRCDRIVNNVLSHLGI